ncbi:MAG: metalloregulator ArsR/SmtB family transcription factor [Coprobacillus sp.]|nr:metalloregulator ArsR/SmtB family transcription factor [Coprobacillus sp.]
MIHKGTLNDAVSDSTITAISQLLSVAADETRLRILLSLYRGEKCVKEIQEIVGASQSLVSHQLSVLKKFNLVSSRKDKNLVYYSLNDYHIISLIQSAYEHITQD